GRTSPGTSPRFRGWAGGRDATGTGRLDRTPASGEVSCRPLPAEAFPSRAADVAPFVRSLGLPGLIDVHVHLLPHRRQEAVWRFFDRLEDPPWPVTYRADEATRLATLRDLGVIHHTALAYGHKPGV